MPNYEKLADLENFSKVFSKNEIWKKICEEYEHIKAEHSRWSNYQIFLVLGKMFDRTPEAVRYTLRKTGVIPPPKPRKKSRQRRRSKC